MELPFPFSTMILFLKKIYLPGGSSPSIPTPTPTPAPTPRFKEILSIRSKLCFVKESEKKLWDESDMVFAPKELTKPQENKTKS